MKRQSQQGIALVITLILLSVITFMAVTFLVVSRHEAEQVDTTTQQNVAKFAALGIEQQAEAQISALMLGLNNGYTNFGLLVSTNYDVRQGYDPTPAVRANVNNVSYHYNSANGGGPLSQPDQQQMLSNLLYLPRAPVFISTNRNQLNLEFRFFHDLNGNGVFDTNGLVTNMDNNGNVIMVGGVPSTSVQVGDPEWIGFLEHPDQRHSSSNFFLSRGAFIAIPIGNALDINYVHNQAKFVDGILSPTSSAYEGFLRNEGVGSWEINLAAFLHNLNTNWDFTNTSYSYITDTGVRSKGTSFDDAASIIQYRYNGGYNSLNNFRALYPQNGQISPGFLFGNYYVDGYSAGPLLNTVWPLPVNSSFTQPINSSWSGADNPIQIVRPRDLLTLIPALPSASSPLDSFTNRLYSAGTGLDTYSRYTFYRMLAQMGVGSAPEPAPYPVGGSGQPGVIRTVSVVPVGATNSVGGRNQMSFGTVPEAFPYLHGRKMNLNYVNVNGTNATSFIPWTPAQFFTNAADRLLRSYYPTNFAISLNGTVVVTNLNINFIPIYPVNYYTPAVHRLLQLAANMYDASTNKSGNAAPDNFDFPSVFRPIYSTTGKGANAFVYIAGYYEVSNNLTAYQNAPLDLRRVIGTKYDVDSLQQPLDFLNNVYGIPYVIGARKGFPAFDKFSFSPVVQWNRALQVVKAATNTPLAQWHINTQYSISISNFLAVELWNSYASVYPRNVRILATNDVSMFLTNNAGIPTYYITNLVANVLVSGNPPQLAANTWAGVTATPTNYIRPIITGVQMIPPSVVIPPSLQTNFSSSSPLPITTTPNYYAPQWTLFITNRVRVIMQDMPNGLNGQPGRLIDYIELSGVDSSDNINSELAALTIPNGVPNLLAPGWLWGTNAVSANMPIPTGIYNQLWIAAGVPAVPSTIWSNVPSGGNVSGAAAKFYQFMVGSPSQGVTAQVPFVANSIYRMTRTWSANDPLVHYLASDLTNPKAALTNAPQNLLAASQTNIFAILPDINKISSRYNPWNQNVSGSPVQNEPQLAFIDPMIRSSDAWQFPTNKYPNIGWIGRVHRGTPWQTVYMKATPVTTFTNWQNWSGDTLVDNFGNIDAAVSQPMNDWRMLDLFTTAPNDNASRGQLSVNQTNLAAWAAVLDGVVALSNSPTGPAPMVISSTSTTPYPPTAPSYQTNTIQYVVSIINSQRTNYPGGIFSSVGQVLSVPQLTTASPYINLSGTPNNDTNLTDAVYERIPQQIASLVKVGTPRYAIYAYGQALKPADRSIVQSGPSFGMCTNYQITGEVLTRTIVRFDNMPVPGQPPPGTIITNAIPVVNRVQPFYAIVTNVVPPMKAVVESFSILGPDQ